jgi:hypothetical protein
MNDELVTLIVVVFWSYDVSVELFAPMIRKLEM